MRERLLNKGNGDRSILSPDACAFTHIAPEGFFEENLPTWCFRHIPDDVGAS
jgi:hypothetical protein